MEVLLWLLVLLATATVAAWRGRRWRSRQRQLMVLCDRAGLRFSAVDVGGTAAWVPFRWLLRGNWVGVENVVCYEGDDVAVFDLLIEERGIDDDTPPVRKRVTCAALPLRAGAPRMVVRPTNPIDGLTEAVTGEAIDLELEAFNRRFTVRADDRRFAVAFCDQRMMAAMLRLPAGIGLATNEDRVLLFGRELPAGEVLLLLEAARAIRDAVPPVIGDLYAPRPARSPYEDRWLQGHWSPDPTYRGDPGAHAR